MSILRNFLKLRNIQILKHPVPYKGIIYEYTYISVRNKNANNNEVGCCMYVPITGQVSLMKIDDEFQHMGIGTKILQMCIEDLKEKKVSEMWMISNAKEFLTMSAFKGKMHKRDPIQPHVGKSGYFMRLD